jgi:hypothetical protein
MMIFMLVKNKYELYCTLCINICILCGKISTVNIKHTPNPSQEGNFEHHCNKPVSAKSNLFL